MITFIILLNTMGDCYSHENTNQDEKQFCIPPQENTEQDKTQFCAKCFSMSDIHSVDDNLVITYYNKCICNK